MKIFIPVDMEGVACVTHSDLVSTDGKGYEAARKWMPAETNAAIEGAMEAGAQEFVVVDIGRCGARANPLLQQRRKRGAVLYGSNTSRASQAPRCVKNYSVYDIFERRRIKR